MDTNNKDKKTAWIVAGVAVIILGALIFIFRSNIYQELNNLKLVPEKETFTELYFNDPNNLPKQIVAGRKGSFSFTIHNEEGIQTSYPYTVFFQNQKGKRSVFAKGTIALDSDGSTSITVPYSFSNSNQKGMVVVLLTGLNQQIDFLLPNTN